MWVWCLCIVFFFFFFFNDTATTEIYTRKDTLSLYDALPISLPLAALLDPRHRPGSRDRAERSEEHTSELQSPFLISYAVFCLKKKKHHYNVLHWRQCISGIVVIVHD